MPAVSVRGKTTTIEILEEVRARDAGEVRVLGLDPGDRRSGPRLRSQLGVVLQELAVEPFLSVRQVLQRNAGYYPAPRPVGEVVELIGLAEKADAKVKTLSGGQQRRLDVGLLIVVIWGVVGAVVALRRFQWAPLRT